MNRRLLLLQPQAAAEGLETTGLSQLRFVDTQLLQQPRGAVKRGIPIFHDRYFFFGGLSAQILVDQYFNLVMLHFVLNILVPVSTETREFNFID